MIIMILMARAIGVILLSQIIDRQVGLLKLNAEPAVDRMRRLLVAFTIMMASASIAHGLYELTLYSNGDISVERAGYLFAQALEDLVYTLIIFKLYKGEINDGN